MSLSSTCTSTVTSMTRRPDFDSDSWLERVPPLRIIGMPSEFSLTCVSGLYFVVSTSKPALSESSREDASSMGRVSSSGSGNAVLIVIPFLSVCLLRLLDLSHGIAINRYCLRKHVGYSCICSNWQRSSRDNRADFPLRFTVA